MGAWIAYGLGSVNRDLPTFTVLVSRGSGRQARQNQPLYERLWGSRLPPLKIPRRKTSVAPGDPVLYLTNPSGSYHAACAAICSTNSADLNEIHARASRRPRD